MEMEDSYIDEWDPRGDEIYVSNVMEPGIWEMQHNKNDKYGIKENHIG